MATKVAIQTEEEIFDRLKKVIVEVLRVKETDITLETNYKHDLDTDSVDMADLLMALEEEFNATIPDDGLSKLQTVGDTVKYINSLNQK
jgi:acyl carrier protein